MGLKGMRRKLARLMREFEFSTLSSVFANPAEYPVVSIGSPGDPVN
jgi:hypothetical protein